MGREPRLDVLGAPKVAIRTRQVAARRQAARVTGKVVADCVGRLAQDARKILAGE